MNAVRLAALGLVLLAALPARTAPPEVFVSSLIEPTTGAATGVTSEIAVRPNNEAAFYVYVKPDQLYKSLTVIVSADEAGKQPLASGTVINTPANENIRVALKSVAPVAAPVPPAAPAAGEKAPAASPAPLGAILPQIVYLQLRKDDNQEVVDFKPKTIALGLLNPRSYIQCQTTISSVGAGYTITADLFEGSEGGKSSAVPSFRGPPAKVHLDVRPELIPNLDKDSIKDGTYQALVPKGTTGGKFVRLEAKNLKFNGTPGKSVFNIAVDGYERALIFETDFAKGNNGTPFGDKDKRQAARVDVPRYAIPGKPFLARLEVFNDPIDAKPELRFFRTIGGEPELVTGELKGPRFQEVRGRVGEAGEFIVRTEVRDHVVPVDTAFVYGDRVFELKLAPEVTADPPLPAVLGPKSIVTLDDTAPKLVKFVNLPTKQFKATSLRVYASGKDDESGIEKVLFFMGDPPLEGDKPAPGGKVEKGVVFVPPAPKEKGKEPAKDKPVVSGDPVYTAEFDLPEVKGKIKLGVRYVNRVGLATDEIVDFQVIDPPPPKKEPTTGEIEGRVIKGSTPELGQPGMTVQLLDAGGKLVSAATTKDDGTFKFSEIKPGPYMLYAIKPSDFNARGSKTVVVVAGETTKKGTTIELKR